MTDTKFELLLSKIVNAVLLGVVMIAMILNLLESNNTHEANLEHLECLRLRFEELKEEPLLFDITGSEEMPEILYEVDEDGNEVITQQT